MEDIDTYNFVEIIQQLIENSSTSIIDKIIPIVSMFVVGTISILTIYLNNRANKKLSVYNRKKDELASFSKLCGKYFGIVSILAGVLKGKELKPRFTRYTYSVIQKLSKYKWEILSYVDLDKTIEISNKMKHLEYHIEDLRKSLIADECLEQSNNPGAYETQKELRNNVESVTKVNINNVTEELQKLLIEQKQMMAKKLDNF